MEGSSGVRREVMESLRRLQARDSAYFQRRLPSRERWRLYREFRHQAAFLDIETTGISPNGSDITLVGLFDGRSYRGFVKGQNMHLLPVALARYKLIVTYNGAIFDLPFIQSQLGPLFQHHAHIDLRYPLGRLGYRGGLKVIESQLSHSTGARHWHLGWAGCGNAMARAPKRQPGRTTNPNTLQR